MPGDPCGSLRRKRRQMKCNRRCGSWRCASFRQIICPDAIMAYCLLGRWSVWFLFVCSFAVFFWVVLWLGTHVTSRCHKSIWVHETWQFCATPTYTRLAWYRQSEKVGRCRSKFVCNLFYTLSYLYILYIVVWSAFAFPIPITGCSCWVKRVDSGSHFWFHHDIHRNHGAIDSYLSGWVSIVPVSSFCVIMWGCAQIGFWRFYL